MQFGCTTLILTTLIKKQETFTYQPIANEYPKEVFEEEIEKEINLQQPFITQPIEEMFFETFFQRKNWLDSMYFNILDFKAITS